MKITATVTDEQLRELHAWAVAHCKAHGHPDDYAEYCKGTSAMYQAAVALGARRARKGWTRALARARCAALINERVLAKCPGRDHRRHVGDVCQGSCCTTCGGPIDENDACRC